MTERDVFGLITSSKTLGACPLALVTVFAAYSSLFTAYCSLLTILNLGERPHFLSSLFSELPHVMKNAVKTIAPSF
jgi:hypothetical protein